MRTLLLIRHAKAVEPNFVTSDFDRSLAERGKSDAILMGEVLKKHSLVPDLIISSGAKRTRQTAKRIAEGVKYDNEKIVWEEKLFHCNVSTMEHFINCISEKVNTLFIVAHNPTITDFANSFAPFRSIEIVPTCGIVGVHINIESWRDFQMAEKKIFLFDYPKNNYATK